VAEAALPGYEAVLHYGIVAPAGTPRPIIDTLGAVVGQPGLEIIGHHRRSQRRA